jgi:hypothetical protein
MEEKEEWGAFVSICRCSVVNEFRWRETKTVPLCPCQFCIHCKCFLPLRWCAVDESRVVHIRHRDSARANSSSCQTRRQAEAAASPPPWFRLELVCSDASGPGTFTSHQHLFRVLPAHKYGALGKLGPPVGPRCLFATSPEPQGAQGADMYYRVISCNVIGCADGGLTAALIAGGRVSWLHRWLAAPIGPLATPLGPCDST